MRRDDDLFFALLTPPGQGAIGVIHLEGPGAARLTEECFVHAGKARQSGRDGYRRLRLGDIRDNGTPLDQVIVEPLGAGVFRINCHGGAAAVREICLLFERLGARPGRPEEAGLRRLERGEISAVAFEALSVIRECASKTACELVIRSASLLEEACRNGDLDALRDLSAARPVMERVLRVHRVAVLGPENAGKSTLVNALCERSVSVVSPVPGTTRDVVRSQMEWGGVSMELIDTAGLAEAGGDDLKKASIEDGLAAIREADLLLFVSSPDTAQRKEMRLPELPVVEVFSKADLGGDVPEGRLAVSGLEGEGIERLLNRIKEVLMPAEPRPGAFTERQQRALQAVLEGRVEPSALLHFL